MILHHRSCTAPFENRNHLVSDETPSAESPSDVPEIPTPSEPTVEAPAAVAAPAEAEAPAADIPTAETATPPVAPPADPVPVAPPPVAAASEPKRKGVFVPVWVGAVILMLVVAALGFGIGRWTADDSTHESNAIANNGGIVPQFPNDNRGNGNNGNGNSGGQTTPQTPQTPTTPSTGAAFLGVGTQNATGGVEVTTVGPNTPASKAGLAAGDVITAIDNTSVTTTTALRAAIQSHASGDTVTVHYTRAGQSATVNVTLGTQSQ
jgi:membrane-associated protease RseP (regulator of RpoE activity)